MPSVSDIIKNNRVIKYYSTGSIGLDYIISGGLGLPSGSMIEFFGRSDSGKTATVLQIVKTALLEKPTSKVLYFNIDGKFNP
jgi:RecA/RadA recombinase